MSGLLRELRIKAVAQREVIAIQEKNIKNQQEKLSSIENTIEFLSSEGDSPELHISSGSADGDYATDENSDDCDDEDEDDSLPDPIWDESDDVFRCTACSWEVTDGFCSACMMEFKWDVDEVQWFQQAVSTHSDALNGDRSRIPRSTTPLYDISPSASAPSPEYYDRAEEFIALLQRGATRLMCETFHLSFSEQEGIIAWADEDIFEQFSGPAMLEGDFWKIHLGRCIELDEDDLDGSMFIEGLLEDVLLYPLEWSTVNKYRNEAWETVEESPGIWITRLMSARIMGDSDGESECSDAENYQVRPSELWDTNEICERLLDASPAPNTGPVITFDEYDELSDDEEEDEAQEDSEVEIIDDPGEKWKAGVPDAVWAPESEKLDNDNNEVSSGDSDSDDFDSDFDSDEDLSEDGARSHLWFL